MVKTYHERQSLSPWLYITVGLAVSIYSAVVRVTSDVVNKETMKLFMYVGFVFLAIGIIRLIIKTVRKEPSTKPKETFAQKLADVKPYVQTQNARQIIICKKCNTRNYSTSNFCHMCGESLK